MAYVDVILRARSAYLEGEKYLEWNRRPELKTAHFDALLAKKEARLRRELQAGKMQPEELAQRLELARFERDQSASESSLKYAYIWFQTAVELFSPPESRWVRLSRVKMAEAKEAWRAELKAKKIPFEEFMLE